MKVLLIGGGFVGTHLQQTLQKKHDVCVADLPAVAATTPGMQPIDIGDSETICRLFRKFMPTRIFLLAAISSVALSWKKPDLTISVNIIGTLNVLSAMREIVPNARLIYIGSEEEYGTRCSGEHPFSEETDCDPKNPYAVSKYASGLLLELLAVRDHLDIVHLRPCNHFGPGQKEGFVVSDFCSQIARIERGLTEPVIKVGCLDARRDFLFVKDVIDAYTKIAEADHLPNKVYNLSSGHAHAIQEVLDILLNLSVKKIQVEIDPQKFRPVDVPILVSTSQRTRQDLQWEPKYTLEEALHRTLNWWRDRI